MDIQALAHQALTFLPILGLVLPGMLSQDGLEQKAPWANGLIAGAAVFGMAVLSVVAGDKLTGNPQADIALFTATFSALLAGPLKGLHTYLQGNWLTFLKAPAPQAPQYRRASVASGAYQPPKTSAPPPPQQDMGG